MFTYFTNRQLQQIKSEEGKLEVVADFMNKFTARQLASDLVKFMAEKEEGKVLNKITITPEEKAFLDSIIMVQDKTVLPVVPPVKEKKPRKKVEYSEAELKYKTAFMNNVIIPCKGKTEAEKAKIKAAAEKVLKPLREAADKAKEARHNNK